MPPGYPTDGLQDFFCGGHAFLRDGSLLFANGTDAATPCSLCTFPNPPCSPYGSIGAWRLNTRGEPPSWMNATPTSSPLPRWYPTVVELPDGKALVLGHYGFPNPTPLQEESRDEFTPTATAGSWASGIENRKLTPCDPPTLLNVFDYPRIHLLASGELIWTTAVALSGGSWEPRPSAFLDLTPTNPCLEQRWKEEVYLQAPATSIPHFDGSSVHLITWDHVTGEFTELLYAIGGAEIGFADIGSCSDPDFDPTKIHGVVDRMVLDPLESPSDVGFWETAPSLNLPRVNHNAVLLLDGSIVVIGGLGWDGTTCAWRRNVERLVPREVVEGASQQPWKIQADQAIPRQYHSVAGLLPDGRVVSAGGVNLPASEIDYCKPDHTVEIFTPQYWFGGVKPAISRASLTDPAAGHYTYGLPFDFWVTVEATAAFDRMALVRPGATHAFDSSQLYVELPVQQPAPTGGGPLQIFGFMPPNSNYAPPGYYLLVVVDNLGRPSAGEWIRLVE